ncbi:lipoprotein [Mesomycoplasma dispar]|uniref:Lipoprotein n=1 Tax=Mesomycoplasma dispar TaxID=86660 RepID=A0AAJ5NQY2_9BACT|nr:P80 family lipoprotein [Mesomycoplasma dispar]AJR12374.1 hypothetical protein MDIS_03270 [Mesomycoplasma dispar]VEU62254.1 lipoprotein [Mesomycoplasma dispar]
MKLDNDTTNKFKFSNKFKKIFLTSLFSIAPITFLAAACTTNEGSSTDSTVQKRNFLFDSNEDNKLVFGHSFSSSGNEAKALKKIIELWNSTAKDKKDFMKMEEQYFQGGYNGASASINNYLETKDRIKLPNIATNYASLLAIVNKYSMTYPIVSDFTSNEEPQNEEEKTTKKFLKEQGISDFLQINSEIPFLDTKGVYTLPFGKSTEGLVINKILFGWIIDKATSDSTKPATIKAEDKNYFNEFIQLSKKSTEDVAEIQKIWKEYSSNQEALAGYEFKKSDLENFVDLQKLSSRILKAFPKALTGSALSSAKSVLGVDNSATLIYSLARSLSEGDKSKEVTVLDRKKNLIDYTSFIDQPNSDRYKNFEKIYGLISEGIKDKSIYFTSSGEYNSTYFRNHQQVFSIGSSAGFHHNFVKAGSKNYLVGFNHNGNEQIYSVFSPKFAAVVKASDLSDTSKDLSINSINKKDKVTIKARFLPKIKELAEKNKEKQVFYFTDKYEKPSGIAEGTYEVLDKNEQFKPIVIPGYTGLQELSGSSAVNDNELDMVAAPHKFDKNSKTTGVFAQGPDLIFIHATEKEDRAVKAFVNWILTEKVDFGDAGKITPIEYFAKSSSYLLPLKSTLSDGVYTPKNQGQQVALNQFKKFSSESSKTGYSLVYDNADAASATFRSTLDTTVSQMQSLKASDGKLRTFAEFLTILRTNLGPSYRSRN